MPPDFLLPSEEELELRAESGNDEADAQSDAEEHDSELDAHSRAQPTDPGEELPRTYMDARGVFHTIDRNLPPYSAPRPRRPQKRKIRSLVDLSIVTLAKNIEETSIEALEHLPDEILWRVYKYHSTKWSVSPLTAPFCWNHRADAEPQQT